MPEEKVSDEGQNHEQGVGWTSEAKSRQPLDEGSHEVLWQVRRRQEEVSLTKTMN